MLILIRQLLCRLNLFLYLILLILIRQLFIFDIFASTATKKAEDEKKF